MKRIISLDIIRGLAILLVIIYHYTTRYNTIFDSEFVFSFSYGFLGVPLFFILSGFVISSTLERTQNIIHFIVNRIIRLFPTFWISSFFIFFVYKISSANLINDRFNISINEFLINLTMIPNIFGSRYLDGAFWSLPPELFFYSFIGLCFFIFYKRKNIIIYLNLFILFFVILDFFIKIPILRIILNVPYMLIFFIGVINYRIYKNGTTKFLITLLISNCLVGSFIYTNYSTKVDFLTFIVAVILFQFIFYLGLKKNKNKIFENKFFSYFGNISFPLYLVHQNVGYIIIFYLDFLQYEFLKRSIALLLVISVAHIIHFYFEKTYLSKFKTYIIKLLA